MTIANDIGWKRSHSHVTSVRDILKMQSLLNDMASFEGDNLVVFPSEIWSDKKGGLCWE